MLICKLIYAQIFVTIFLEAVMYSVRIIVTVFISFFSLVYVNASGLEPKIICEFDGMAPEYPEAYLEIQPGIPVITNVQAHGSYRDNFIDSKKASRHLVDWSSCSSLKEYDASKFSFQYNCPLKATGINKTVGNVNIDLQSGSGKYRWDLIDTNSGAISTVVWLFKNCRSEPAP
jgi:hypothetical protein